MGSLIAACPCATSVSQLYTQPKIAKIAIMFMDNSLAGFGQLKGFELLPTRGVLYIGSISLQLIHFLM